MLSGGHFVVRIWCTEHSCYTCTTRYIFFYGGINEHLDSDFDFGKYFDSGFISYRDGRHFADVLCQHHIHQDLEVCCCDKLSGYPSVHCLLDHHNVFARWRSDDFDRVHFGLSDSDHNIAGTSRHQ